MFDLNATTIKTILFYDAETGVFTWLAPLSRNTKPGTVAGRRDRRGYRGINIAGKKYAEHRLAWLYVTGDWPASGLQIDHINRIGDDNRFSNLRAVSASTNCLNRSNRLARIESGDIGITWHKQLRKWQVSICLRGERAPRYVGVYDTKSAAREAYAAAAIEVAL